MRVDELLKCQKTELKQKFFSEKENRDLSYQELADINELVTDDELIKKYSNVDFSMDDFFCTAGKEFMSIADLLVSILNYVAEEKEWKIDKCGFGYTMNKENIPIFSMANGDSFRDGLNELWEQIMC